MKKIILALLCLLVSTSSYKAIAQCAPNISYSGVNSLYSVGSTIANLTPTNTGGAISTTATNVTSAYNFNQPYGIAIDAAGNLYVADTGNNAIKKIAVNGNITTIASGFNQPKAIAIDAAGNIYVADTGNNAVKKIATNNTITVLATGFSAPTGIAVDTAGNVYVANTGNNTIKRIAPNNTVATFYSTLSSPSGVAVDTAGNVYVADTNNNTVKKIDSTASNVTVLGSGFSQPYGITVDGSGNIYVTDNSGTKKITTSNVVSFIGSSGNKGIAVDASGNVYYSNTASHLIFKTTSDNNSTTVVNNFQYPTDIVTDTTGNLYTTDYSNKAIKKIAVDGTVTILDSGFGYPSSIAVDGSGTIYVAYKFNNVVKKIAPNGTIATVTTAIFGPNKLAVDGQGNIFVTDNNGLKKISIDGTITTIPTGNNFNPIDIAVDANGVIYVTNGYAVNKIANNVISNISSTVYYYESMTLDSVGNVYVSSYNDTKIIKIDTDFNQTTIATIDTGSYGLAVDSFGRMYVAYVSNFIKKFAYYSIKPILPQGLVLNTLNGVISGTPEVSSPLTTYTVTIANDCGVATTTLALGTCDTTAIVSQSGSQIVCMGKSTILSVDAKGCNLTYQWYKNGNPIQGATSANLTLNNFNTNDVAAYYCTASGTMDSATSTTINLSIFNAPAISYSGGNNNYVVGTSITPLSPTNTGGAITPSQETVIGLLNPNGVAVDAAGNIYVTENTTAKKIAPDGTVTILYNGFSYAYGITCDAAGNVYVVENSYNTSVKKISVNGTISSIGSGLIYPSGIVLDSAGNIYITENSSNTAVKKISPDGSISTIGGGFYYPKGIAIDSNNTIYVADTSNNAIKKIAPNGFVTTIPLTITSPYGIAVDNSGNIYAAEYYTNTIKKIAPNNTITRTISNTSTVIALAVDTSGSLYTLDGAKTLNKIAPNNETTTLNSGFSYVGAIDTDGAGNLYVASIDLVRKISDTGVSTKLSSINTSLATVDALGNVYAVSNGTVYKITPGGTISIIKTGLSSAIAITVDASSNLYLLENNSSFVKKLSPNGTVTLLGSGFNNPKGLAADPFGNIYVADTGNNAIKKIATNGDVTSLGSGFVAPNDVAVDNSGNLYIADSGNNSIKKRTPDGTITTLTTAFNNPKLVSVDTKGNIFILQSDGVHIAKISPSLRYSISPLLPSGLTIDAQTGIISGTPTESKPNTTYTIAVGNACDIATTTITFAVCTPTTINSQPVSKTICVGKNAFFVIGVTGCNLSYQWLKNGSPITGAVNPTLTIANVSASDEAAYSCAIDGLYGNVVSTAAQLTINTTAEISYNGVNSNYPLGVAINPLTPTITNGSITTAVGSETIIASQINYLQDLVLDTNGNKFVIGAFQGIKKISADGTVTTQNTELGTLNAIAIDLSNYIYVARSNNSIAKISSFGTVTTIGTGFNNPQGIAVDSQGNVYVSDAGNNQIRKIDIYGIITTVATGLDYPSNLTLDPNGNIIVSETYANVIKKITPAGVVSILSNAINYPKDIACDDNGNIYVTENFNGNLKKITPQGLITQINTSYNYLLGLTLDGEGAVYMTNYINGTIQKITQEILYNITPELPQGLTFDRTTGTIAGTPQSYIPQTTYTVSIDNGCGTATATVTFSTCSPTVIYTQPISQNICTSNGITLSVAADACNISYQWYKDGSPIAEATSPYLYIYIATPEQAGNYTCLVTGSLNSLLSDTAVITVAQPPIINYNGAPSGFNVGEPITPLSPTNTGGAIVQENYAKNSYAGPFTNLQITSLTKDSSGNWYFSDITQNEIKKIDSNGNVSLFAGLGFNTASIAADNNGNIYASDPNNSNIIKIDTNGNSTTFGSGYYSPFGVATDNNGNVYIADTYNLTVKKVAPNGDIITSWLLDNYPSYIAVNNQGTIYVSSFNGEIKKIENNTVTTLATNIYDVYGMAIDPQGNAVLSRYNNGIKKIDPNGNVSTLTNDYNMGRAIGVDNSGAIYYSNIDSSNIIKLTGPYNYIIEPALPQGLTFNPYTGVVSGTPTVLTPYATYTVSSQNGCGINYTYLNFAVCNPTIISLQPTAKTVCAGNTVTFEAAGVGSNVTYQWRKGTTNIPGATNAVLTINYATDADVDNYSCIVTGNCGSLITNAVGLTVINNNRTAIIAQPANTNMCPTVGATASFTVATVMPAANYTWQYRVVTATNLNPAWTTITNSVGGIYSGYATATLGLTRVGTLPENNTQYRVIVAGTCGSVISDIAIVNLITTLKAGTITAAASVCQNSDITFTLSGYSGTSLQWQSAPSATGTFVNIPGATSAVYTLTGATASSNKSYRVVVSNACTNTSATTAIKTIKVDPTAIAGTVSGGGVVCRLGSGSLTAANYVGKVQWEYSTNGVTFINAPKSTDNQTALPFRTTSTTSTGTTYSINTIDVNLYFRIKVSSGSCTPVYSNTVQFTIGSQAIAGTVSPASVELCPRVGTTLTLSNAVGTITWQKSTNYTLATPTWTAIANSNTTTLSTGVLTSSTAYRAMVTIGSCSTVYSNIAIVAIAAKPVAKPISANTTVPSGKTALTAMCTTDVSKILSIGNGYVGTIQWQSSVTSATAGFTNIPGATSQSYTVTNPVAGPNYFRATFTNSCGATVNSTAVTVYYTNCVPAKTTVVDAKLPFDVVAYPNPYNEDFKLNLSTSSQSEVTIVIYDMTGKLLDKTVLKPAVVNTTTIGKGYPSGVYNVIITQGDALKTIRVIKR